MEIQYRYLTVVLLIAVVLFAGALGFKVIEGWSWFDGLYMTLITMTTVGYGEVQDLSPGGRVFNVFVIIAAVMTGGFLVATFTHTMLEFEFGKHLGRRRMAKELSQMRNHIIVCGAGRVGRSVARELQGNRIPCVVIERTAERAEWAVKEDIPVLIGAGTTEAVLAEARIDTAQGLVAAVTSDPDNLYIILTARGMREDLKIIARASEEDAISKFKRAGANEVVSPYHFVGHRIAQLFLHPHVMDFMDSAFLDRQIDLRIEEVEIKKESPLVGKTLVDFRVRRDTGVVVLALRKADGRFEFNPPPEALIDAGDYLIVVGASEHLDKLERILES